MNVAAIRAALGFVTISQITPEDGEVTVDVKKTFDCATSKGLAGHFSFVWESQNHQQVNSIWGLFYPPSVCFVRTQSIENINTFLYSHAWVPPGGGDAYRVVPGSIKERRRRGQ